MLHNRDSFNQKPTEGSNMNKQKIYGKYYGGSSIPNPDQEAAFKISYDCRSCGDSGVSLFHESDSQVFCDNCYNAVISTNELDLIMPNQSVDNSHATRRSIDLKYS